MVPLHTLPAGLARLGLRLGAADLQELSRQLLGGRPHEDFVRWEGWLAVFSEAGEAVERINIETPSTGESSAASRRRRLTLSRLLVALRHSVGAGGREGLTDASKRVTAWFAARDPSRSGRVPIATMSEGLRAHGVIVSDADAALAAAEIDPRGGGSAVDYEKLGALLREPIESCPMPS